MGRQCLWNIYIEDFTAIYDNPDCLDEAHQSPFRNIGVLGHRTICRIYKIYETLDFNH